MAYDRRQSETGVPQEGPGGYRDYRLEIGTAEVPVGAPRGFQVLDPERAEVLRAWTECLIPGRGARPSATGVGAAEYVDASVALAPVLREGLLRALDRLVAIAAAAGDDFRTAGLEARTDAVRSLELQDRSGAFEMVRDFTYEAYYGHPLVLRALQSELDWDGFAPTQGSAMEPFDEGLLERVRSLPPRYREVPTDG